MYRVWVAKFFMGKNYKFCYTVECRRFQFSVNLVGEKICWFKFMESTEEEVFCNGEKVKKKCKLFLNTQFLSMLNYISVEFNV